MWQLLWTITETINTLFFVVNFFKMCKFLGHPVNTVALCLRMIDTVINTLTVGRTAVTLRVLASDASGCVALRRSRLIRSTHLVLRPRLRARLQPAVLSADGRRSLLHRRRPEPIWRAADDDVTEALGLSGLRSFRPLPRHAAQSRESAMPNNNKVSL